MMINNAGLRFVWKTQSYGDIGLCTLAVFGVLVSPRVEVTDSFLEVLFLTL